MKPAPRIEALPGKQNAESQQMDNQSLSNKMGMGLKRHYLAFINILLSVYILLPLSAPVLMKTGQVNVADVIYKLYKPLCHQLAYRSFFLFGEQAVYPRELAGIEALVTYETATGLDGEDMAAASAFRGNEQIGYKTALCQRDLAIYASLLLFGLVFALNGRKLKPLHWLVWLILALGPMGLDGLSQLISQMNIPALSWFAMRESTPFLRVVTGVMFGWFTAWFGLPSIEEIINEKKQTNKTLSVTLKGN